MAFTYNADGELLSIDRPNGVSTTYAYDADGWVTQIKEGTLTTIDLNYDNGGRIIGSARTGFLQETTPVEDWDATYDSGNVLEWRIRADCAHRYSGGNLRS